MKKQGCYIIPLLLLFLTQCAKQTQPTGGEKDETPPKLLRSNPSDRQTNFNNNEIELVFDELIQVNSPREQLIITPSIGKEFEAEARKNKVVLKLNSDLKENTTYTISFRESIQDLTERNPAENLKLAFSTGDLIDSLSIKGRVYNLLEDKALNNYTVAAVPYSDTTTIFKHEAQWITFTDKKGEYSLDNLKEGTYIVYTFDDVNKNLIVDSKSESYGFIGDSVVLTSNLTTNIPVVRLDARPLKLISAKPIGAYFNVRATKGIKEYTLANKTNEYPVYSKFDDVTTIKVYNTIPDADSILVHLTAMDSIDNTIDTLLYIKFDTRSKNLDKFSVKLEYLDFHKNKSLLKGEINFSKPINKIIYDSIYIKLDSVNNITFSEADFKLTKRNTQLILEKSLPKEMDFTQAPSAKTKSMSERVAPMSPKTDENKVDKTIIPYNTLIIPKGTFRSVENDSSTATQSAIKIITPENSGVLLVTVEIADNVIIEVLDKSFNIIQRSTSKNARFENLPPTDYQLRIIVDKNSNGLWDPGNYFLKVEPEPVTFYKNEKGLSIINLKANWEVGPLLINQEQFVDN